LASAAHILAERVNSAYQARTDEQRQLLGVSATEPIGYRRVRLICADHGLSEADNWCAPVRLSPEMNRVLDTTDTAFGRAVQTLNFRRRTLSATLLWSPPSEGALVQIGGKSKHSLLRRTNFSTQAPRFRQQVPLGPERPNSQSQLSVPNALQQLDANARDRRIPKIP
jgi:chorismate-pyruvate lyase